MSEATRIPVGGDQPYEVVVGEHLLGELPGLLGERVRRVLVVHPGALRASAEAVRLDLEAHGYQALAAEVPGGGGRQDGGGGRVLLGRARAGRLHQE